MVVCKMAMVLLTMLMLVSCGGASAEAALDMARAAAQYPDLVYRQGKTQMNVALTFDDGPDGHFTPAILDILEEKGAPATFFVVGYRAKGHPDVIKRIVDEGHCLANHSWNHPDMSRLSAQNIATQLSVTDNVLQKITGSRTEFFRPPYGAMSESVLAVAKQQGHKVILWSVDPQDWRNYPPQTILQRIIGAVQPGGIVLQHCTNNGTLHSLRDLIDQLRARGYHLVTLPQLLDYQATIPIQLLVNGQQLEYPQAPPHQTLAGVSMVPLQAVLQAIHFPGSFSVRGNQVTVYTEGQENPVTIELTKPEPDQSKLLVPVRALANGLNLELTWDEASKTITLNQPPPPAPVQQVSRGGQERSGIMLAQDEKVFSNKHWLCEFVL